jgi:transposase
MQASHMSTPTAGHCGTIFVAIELSQKTWLITLHSPDQDRFSRHKLEGGDHAGLLSLIEKVRTRVTERLGAVPRVVSCYEAGYDGFWLHRLLEAGGITNFVFDAASIAVEQRSRRAKTDRIDGELLLRTLMAHLRGEPRVVRIVRVPSVEQEDARRASRERDRLITEQTGHTNRIKSLLRLSGMAVGHPRRGNWLAWLTPSPWNSGSIDREQGISKAGNRRARQKAIELAWLWLRHQPDSALSRWFITRTANAGKRTRRIAIVALARKLIVALWRYLTTGLVPKEATMKA